MTAERVSRFELISLTSDVEVAQVAANAWLDSVDISNQRSEPQFVALSGGRIAKHFFDAIAGRSKGRAISLAGVHFFWADERCVPPDHPESNFCLADKFLFQPLGISPNQIHRIRGEENPEKAASQATEEIRHRVPKDESNLTVLDFIFLGMGEDGHVASLFPNVPMAPSNAGEVYRPVVAPKPPPYRITLDYAPLRTAREVWVLASGVGKEEALQASMRENGGTPLARVLQFRLRTKIFTDTLLATARHLDP
jgi:6-phosphogluconolactonase